MSYNNTINTDYRSVHAAVQSTAAFSNILTTDSNNTITIHEDSNIIIGDDTYTYTEIKGMLKYLKELSKKEAPELFI